MDRPVRAGGRAIALAVTVLLAAACGSSSSPAPAASAAASSGVAASVAPPATGSAATAPASAAPSVAAPSSAASTAPSAAASTSADGSMPQPAGTPCDWLDKATIDASLGLSVGKPILMTGGANNGKACTWLSTAPRGGVTVSILFSAAQIDGMVANYQKVPGGQLVSGLGVKAMALGLTGQTAPLPKSHFQVLVDYGSWGLSVDASGPDVTVGGVSALAAAIALP